MYYLLLVIAVLTSIRSVDALQISEIYSNPLGDDSGREWVEIYNDEQSLIVLSKIGVSIKGAKAVPVTQVSSQETVSPGSYAVIGSTLSGATLFAQDYPVYQGVLGKAQMSLVNTGTANIALYYDGVMVSSLDIYTPAKEAKSLARISDTYGEQSPTPGASNQSPASSAAPESQQVTPPSTSVVEQNTVQVLGKQILDVPEFLLKLPKEMLVIAGADTEYVLRSSLSKGSLTRPVVAHWSFGDGGEKEGSTTTYAYAYTGIYNVVVDAWSGEYEGRTSMKVKVVSPNILIGSVTQDMKGSFVELVNPNNYDLMISQWKLSIDGVSYVLPRNTTLFASSTTKISGKALGFGYSAISSTTKVLLMYPHNEVVTAYAGMNPPAKSEKNDVSARALATTSLAHSAGTQGSQKVVGLIHDKTTQKDLVSSSSPRIISIRSHEGGVLSWIKGFFRKG